MQPRTHPVERAILDLRLLERMTQIATFAMAAAAAVTTRTTSRVGIELGDELPMGALKSSVTMDATPSVRPTWALCELFACVPLTV